MMRTTLDIEDDILQAAKELAEQEGSTAGRVISALARRGLMAPAKSGKRAKSVKNGIPILRSRGEAVTLEHVKELMDREGV